MNKSQIFKKAHQTTKQLVANTNFDYRATFALVLKQLINNQSSSIVKILLEMGLTVWQNHGKKRIYMSCEQFNEVTNRDYSLNSRNNKIFYDFATNAIMRSYKGKAPKIEVQF